MRLVAVIVVTLALLGLCPPANAQTMTYQGGSIYDLDPPAQQSTRVVEAISGADDMQAVADLAENDILRTLARPVGRFTYATANGELGHCTASLIADDLILTNHHCIRDASEAMLWMGYLIPRSRQGVAQYAVELPPVEADEALDYAILQVRGTPGTEWGHVELAPSEAGPRQSLFIIHHPGGFAQRISLGRCRANDPARDGDDLLHVCDTTSGSSGAPVFDNGTRKVVALHYAAVDLKGLNAGKRMARLVEASARLRELADQKAEVTQAEGASQPPLSPAAREWTAIQGTSSCAILDRFIELHGSSPFAPYADARKTELNCGQTQVAAVPQVTDVGTNSKADATVGSSGCPTTEEQGTRLSYSNAELTSAVTHALTAGGNARLSECPGIGGSGYVAKKPDITIDYSGETNRDLRIRASADCDTVLLANTSNGTWTFNDDTNVLDPEILLSNASSGRIDIWVGTTAEANCAARLHLETVATPKPAEPAPEASAASAAVTSCPSTTERGAEFTYSNTDLASEAMHNVNAGGKSRLSQCPGIGGSGYVSAKPDFTIDYSGATGRDLRIQARSGCDTVLLANTSSGAWLFNDDTNALNPEIRLSNAGSGRIDIWVGTTGEDYCAATLHLETFNTQAAAESTPQLTAAAAVTSCPSTSERGAEFAYSNADLVLEKTHALTAGGTSRLAECTAIGGSGFLAVKPDFTIDYTGETGRDLRIQAASDCDTVLLANTSNGSWVFNDDTNVLNPEIRLRNAASGRIDIWVGTVASETCAATLKLETFTAEATVEASADTAKTAICPSPGVAGVQLAYTQAELYSGQSRSVTAGGTNRLSECNGVPGAGYFTMNPDYSLYYTSTDLRTLQLQAEATCDTALLVRNTDSTWQYNDDTNEKNPEIRLADVKDGRIDIWIMTMESDYCTATLKLETF